MANRDPLALHVLEASGRLTPHLYAIEQEVTSAFCDAAALLTLGTEPVDVVVRDAPAITIPELGIGALAPDDHTIFINLDPSHLKIKQAINNELGRTVAHELHHIARRRAGQRGGTLWAAIVHEGLADHFSVEIFGGPPPLWSLALSPALLDSLAMLIDAERDSDSYDHGVWFFGKDPAVVPRWAGYAIGWRAVSEYIQRHPGTQASQLVGLTAAAFHGL